MFRFWILNFKMEYLDWLRRKINAATLKIGRKNKHKRLKKTNNI